MNIKKKLKERERESKFHNNINNYKFNVKFIKFVKKDKISIIKKNFLAHAF